MSSNNMSENNSTTSYPASEKIFGKFLRPNEHIVWGGKTSSRALYREKPGSGSFKGAVGYIISAMVHTAVLAGFVFVCVLYFGYHSDRISIPVLLTATALYAISAVIFFKARKGGTSKINYALTNLRVLTFGKRNGLIESTYDKVTASSFKKTRKNRDIGYIEINTSTLYSRIFIDGIEKPESVFKVLTDAMDLYRRTAGAGKTSSNNK